MIDGIHAYGKCAPSIRCAPATIFSDKNSPVGYFPSVSDGSYPAELFFFSLNSSLFLIYQFKSLHHIIEHICL